MLRPRGGAVPGLLLRRGGLVACGNGARCTTLKPRLTSTPPSSSPSFHRLHRCLTTTLPRRPLVPTSRATTNSPSTCLASLIRNLHSLSLTPTTTTAAELSITPGQKATIHRSLSTAAPAAELDLPPNLILADPKVLTAIPPPLPPTLSSVRHTFGENLGAPLVSSLTESLKVPLQSLQVDEQGNLVLKPSSSSTTVELDPRVFAVPIRKDIVHMVVNWQRANARLGHGVTKRVGDIRGSTKKARPQKGSGRARAGKKHPPHWRGGYKAHGPVPRDFTFKLNKKVRQMGLKVALSAKAREGNLVVVDSLDLPEPKTRLMNSLIVANNWEHTLFIDGSERVSENLMLAVRNLPQALCLCQRRANVLDLVKRQTVVLSVGALQDLTARLL